MFVIIIILLDGSIALQLIPVFFYKIVIIIINFIQEYFYCTLYLCIDSLITIYYRETILTIYTIILLIFFTIILIYFKFNKKIFLKLIRVNLHLIVLKINCLTNKTQRVRQPNKLCAGMEFRSYNCIGFLCQQYLSSLLILSVNCKQCKRL